MLNDPVTAAFGVLLLIGLVLVVAVLRRKAEPDVEPYEPPTHVNVDPVGRTYHVGIDHHSPFCRSADGSEFECECGLSDREVPA